MVSIFDYPGQYHYIGSLGRLVQQNNNDEPYSWPVDTGSGEFLVDGVPVREENVVLWQHNLGYVPQQIFLGVMIQLFVILPLACLIGK